MTVWICS